MEKTVNIGYSSIDGKLIKRKTVIDNKDLPNEVTGFKFTNSPCNPCVALNQDYSCPFSLDVGDGSQASPIWNKLWGLSSNPSLTPESLTSTSYKNDIQYYEPINLKIKVNGNGSTTNSSSHFPILSELTKELNQVENIYNPVITSKNIGIVQPTTTTNTNTITKPKKKNMKVNNNVNIS